MRYIRVIDDLGYEYLTTYQEHCEMVAELQDSGFDFEGCILKQADTIEELCDEFISITDDLKPELLVPKYISPKDTLEIAWKNRFEDEMCYKNVIIYGAIWTDKGLIYVAKMNQEGKLKLL